MKKVIIFHGTGGSSRSYWHPYLKEKLEGRGYSVLTPDLPNANDPNIKEALAYALDNFTFDNETILIGHSSGVPLILSILEHSRQQILQAIFVAGFFQQLDPPNPEPMTQESYDWNVIKEHCKEFIVINSDNDPWGCTDTVGRNLAHHINGKFILAKDQGHMGSLTYNQPYKEFPMLLELIV